MKRLCSISTSFTNRVNPLMSGIKSNPLFCISFFGKVRERSKVQFFVRICNGYTIISAVNKMKVLIFLYSVCPISIIKRRKSFHDFSTAFLFIKRCVKTRIGIGLPPLYPHFFYSFPRALKKTKNNSNCGKGGRR